MALESLPRRRPWRRHSKAFHLLEPAACRLHQLVPPTGILRDHQVRKVDSRSVSQMRFAVSQGERVDRDGAFIPRMRDAGRAFARQRVMGAQGGRYATARRRVRGRVHGTFAQHFGSDTEAASQIRHIVAVFGTASL
jgi:hypothetical protein